MNNTTQLIQKIHLEQPDGVTLLSVYKQHFLTEVQQANRSLYIHTSESCRDGSHHHQLN